MTREEFTYVLKTDPNAKFEIVSDFADTAKGLIFTIHHDDGTRMPYFFNYDLSPCIRCIHLSVLRYVNPNETSEIIIW